MKPSRPRPDLLLVLARTTRHGSTELTGSICYRHDPDLASSWDRHERGTVLSPLFERADGRYDRYADLQVRALLDTSGDINGGRSYGWSYEYRPLSVDLQRAQSMTAFLRRTDQQLAALTRTLGTPGTFADYVTHFTLALGITTFAEHSSDMRADGTHWRWMDVDAMRAWINRHEQTCRTGQR